jgi:mRNA-degrading endonuclease RelE of RelBE toxin-antitoxin system
MFEVVIADAAVVQIELLPIAIQIRIDQIVARLRNWPNVSGAKPLRGPLKGAYRIRTGDYRVLFLRRRRRSSDHAVSRRRPP